VDSDNPLLLEPLVKQQVAELVERPYERIEQDILADYLMDLGAEQEGEWVRSLNLEHVTEQAMIDCDAAPDQYPGSLSVLDFWRTRLTVRVVDSDFLAHFAMGRLDNPKHWQGFERSVAWELVRRLYCSAAQETELERAYQARADKHEPLDYETTGSRDWEGVDHGD
jgi:hypothetical protein